MSRAKISEAAYDQMKNWVGKRPVAALMGEFSSGKSTLLNFLVGLEAAPTQVTATHMPPTWFHHSDTPIAVGLTASGEVEEVDLSCEKTNFREKYLIVRRGLNSETLATCDVIDAPGISDPGLHKDGLRFLSRYMDFVVWCTAASQAWRQTERAAFGKLSKKLRDRSLLVVTRMDKLRNAQDQEKVLKRVTKDAGPLFALVLPLQTPKAAAVPTEERTDDPDGRWVKTGGHGLFAAFAETCASVPKKAALSSAVAKAPEKCKTAASARRVTAKRTQRNAPGKAANTAQKTLAREHFKSRLEEFMAKPENGQLNNEIKHLIATMPCEKAVVNQGNETLLNCLSLESDDLDGSRLVQQLDREFGAFGKRDRVQIDVWQIAGN